jgi:hypothetical protein
MVLAISGEKESAIRVTMLSCASFFCSQTRRSNADSAGKTTRRLEQTAPLLARAQVFVATVGNPLGDLA